MKTSRAWSARLAIAGACLAWAGCGGSDVPDPDSDSHAATSDTPKTIARADAPPPEEPPTPAAAPEPTGPAPKAAPIPTPAPAPTAPGGEAQANPAQDAPAESPAPSADKPAEADKSTVKADSSGTDELLKMSGSPPAADPTPAPSPGASPSPSPATPSQPAAPGAPGAPASPSTVPGPGASSSDGKRDRDEGSGTPGAPSTPASPSAPSAPAEPGLAPPSAAPGRPGGSSGLDRGTGSDSASAGSKAFAHPTTAVAEFIAALKAKDKDRLARATAKHAPTEAVEKHRKIFAAVIDGSISDEELDDMAKALEGYTVIQQIPPRSTGQIDVVVGKVQGKDTFRRTINTRREKEGWKVVDIEKVLDFKPMPIMQRRGGRRR